jgi:hypothetical protein
LFPERLSGSPFERLSAIVPLAGRVSTMPELAKPARKRKASATS